MPRRRTTAKQSASGAAASPSTDTREQLLDLAQELVQTRGYNAFSFRDLAERLGIKTASIHYYFPTKADLGHALLHRYCNHLHGVLEEIAAPTRGNKPPTAKRQLERFMNILYDNLTTGNRMCPGGMLAAEHPTLPESVQQEVQRFFLECEAWLATVLADGRKSGELAFTGTPAATARALLASLEGAMLAARTFNDESRLTEAGRWHIKNLLARS